VSNNPKNVAPASFPFTGQAHTGMFLLHRSDAPEKRASPSPIQS
jgi:hypothetical protein